MSIIKELEKRSSGQCEICKSTDQLGIYILPPKKDETLENAIHICEVCTNQINHLEEVDVNHWRCLNDSMWSEVSAVKVVAYRMLNRLKKEGWPQDLLDMIYLDEEELNWAKSADYIDDNVEQIIHKDANGAILSSGDSVVLTKDLNVKGATFTAKRGEAVRNITLVHDNAEQIEGRVNGQKIVILTQYVKKTS
jgi:protein PhnA